MNRMPSMMSTEPLKRPFHNKYVSPTNTRVGSSIFMNGGYINIGTYYATIQVGNPAQNFSVLIDTGSSNIAIPQKGCSTCGGNTTHFYDPSISSTYQPLTCNSNACNKCSPTNYFQDPKKCVFAQPFCSLNNTNLCGQAITYGGATSALTASLVYDQVCFGGLCVKQHNFGMIVNEYPPESFAQPQGMIDGILGLAFEFNACNPTCTTPILNDLYNNQQLPSQVFGVCLTKQNGGYLDLGYVDQTKIDGPIQYTKITHNSWYNIALLDIQIGGTSIGVPPLFYQKTNDVIGTFVDTGTSVILTNAYAFAALQTTFQTLYSNLPGVGGAGQLFNSSNPCITPQQMGNALSSFPPVSFVFPNADNPSQTFTLDVPASDYILFQQGLYCLGIGSASGLGVVLGDPFMNPFYIVFDQQNSRLGFAKAKNCV